MWVPHVGFYCKKEKKNGTVLSRLCRAGRDQRPVRDSLGLGQNQPSSGFLPFTLFQFSLLHGWPTRRRGVAGGGGCEAWLGGFGGEGCPYGSAPSAAALSFLLLHLFSPFSLTFALHSGVASVDSDGMAEVLDGSRAEFLFLAAMILSPF